MFCRRSFRFSLGSLLFLITLCALWLGVQTDQAIRQRRAIADFKELGLAIHYGMRRTPGGFSSSPKPNWIHGLTGDDDIQTVLGLSGTPNNDLSTDDHVAYAVTSLTDLRDLSLFNSHITDAGLDHVAKLRQLQGLMLGNAKITDAGLEQLVGMRNLALVETGVTAQGVDDLRQRLPDCYIRRQ